MSMEVENEEDVWEEYWEAYDHADDIEREENYDRVGAVPRQKYEEDMENAFAHGYTDAESKYRKMIADGELVELPTVKEHRDEAWEMFSLITSVWYGKQYYFMQDNGLVYSRKSHLTMTKGDALDEFLKEIESDA